MVFDSRHFVMYFQGPGIAQYVRLNFGIGFLVIFPT